MRNIVIGTIAGFCFGLLFGITGTASVMTDNDDKPSTRAGQIADPAKEDTSAPAETETPEQTEEPEPVVTEEPDFVLRKKDLKLKVKILSKQCFGSAGCNVEYEIVPTYLGAKSDFGDTSWDVTIKVLGGEDGPIIDTFNIDGTQYEVIEDYASTRSGSSELTAVVTEVTEAGW